MQRVFESSMGTINDATCQVHEYASGAQKDEKKTKNESLKDPQGG
jgi:hypothetical protein